MAFQIENALSLIKKAETSSDDIEAFELLIRAEEIAKKEDEAANPDAVLVYQALAQCSANLRGIESIHDHAFQYLEARGITQPKRPPDPYQEYLNSMEPHQRYLHQARFHYQRMIDAAGTKAESIAARTALDYYCKAAEIKPLGGKHEKLRALIQNRLQ
ncbi:MAG TPA: hypothetical protein PKX74_06530 [Leptospiraceae bacterium]|nr:hypothetical protein [Leptospiraceae bacterium]HNN60740.1 hypothetical protein [Leptospiraceae bacterium]HNN77006.1 hypothetical protein [Leptospiraceae bacterium]